MDEIGKNDVYKAERILDLKNVKVSFLSKNKLSNKSDVTYKLILTNF